jgi:DNA-binding transcriptional ArsR family regulator
MGITKTALYTEHENELAMYAKAFAHPARIAIVQHLLRVNACINSDLVQEIGLAQATISQHLKELKEVGIIKGTINGTSMNYCIDKEKWLEVKNQFNHLFNELKNSSEESCC